MAGLSCEAFYLLAMNVFLSTPLFEKAIDATPLIVDIHYTRGWSLFPTRIHARDLSIRGTDSHVEWILRFDEIDFDCSLLELATRQKFHVTRARGTGITFRARLKVASPAATRDRVAHLPEIDSLGPVALMPNEPPSKALWDDKAWHLWTVQIDDAIAEHVREVWIENGRFQGDARVAGGFLLKPMRAAYVGPAHVDFRSGSVQIDARTVAEPLVANLDFELARFDPRFAAGPDLFPRMSISVDAKTVIPDLDNLALDLPDSGQLRGRLEIPRLALRVVQGVIRDGTHVVAHGGSVVGTTSAHVVSGGIDLAADVADGKLLVQASLDQVDADFAASIPRATIGADSAGLGLEDLFDDLHGVLEIPDARVPEAARLMDDLPKDSSVRIARGSLRASLHAEGWYAEKRVRGNVTLHGKDLDVLADKLRVRGDANVEGSVGSLRFDTWAATDARIGVVVLEGLVAPSASPAEPFLRLSGLRARAEVDDLDLDHPLRSLRASVAVSDAELFDRESARAALGLGPAVRLASRRSLFEASADVTLDGDRASGSFDATAPGLGLEYAGRRLGLDLIAHGRAHAAHWRSGALSLDEARVVGTHLAVSDAASPSALSVSHLLIAAASPSFVLADPLAHLQLLGAIEGGRMEASTALGDLLPEGSIAQAAKGGAAFDGDVAVQITRHVAKGAASVNFHGIGVSSGKIRIAGNVGAVANIARWDLTERTLGGNVTLAVENVTGGFDPRPGAPDFVADRLDVRASADALDLAHPSMRGVDYALHLGRADLGDARALNTFLPSPTILTVESGHARVSADFGTSRPGRAAVGRLDVLLNDGGIRLNQTHLAGDFSVVVQANGFDPDRAAIDLEGSWVAMRNVRVTGASTDTSAWSGDLVLQSGMLKLAPVPTLEGDLTLKARDASPILGVLFRDSLPRFVAELTSMPSFTAVTHVVVQPQTLAVSDLSASGGDLALRGTYVVRNGDRAAAFIVEKGPWSVGINLDNDGSHLRLFGLNRWYGEHARHALAPTPAAR